MVQKHEIHVENKFLAVPQQSRYQQPHAGQFWWAVSGGLGGQLDGLRTWNSIITR
jgi:hypothetical protein